MITCATPISYNRIALKMQPQVIATITSLDASSKLNFDKLEQVIKADQNLTAFLLKIANSAFYSRGVPVKNLAQAIGKIGFRTIKSMCLMKSSQAVFKNNSGDTNFDSFIWRHSSATSILAGTLAKVFKEPHLAEEAFMGGLLHDIGKVILNAHDSLAYSSVVSRANDLGLDFETVEQSIFVTDHITVGVEADEAWGLPSILAPIIQWHEDPLSVAEGSDVEKKIILFVAYANYLAKCLGYGHSHLGEPDKIAAIEEALGIDEPDQFKTMMQAKLKEHPLFDFILS